MFDKVKASFKQSWQPKMIRLLLVKEAHDVPAIQAEEQQSWQELNDSLREVIAKNIDEKLEYYLNQTLYQQMKAKNSVGDFYLYVSLFIGKTFLHLRLGQLRNSFEILSSLSETLNDQGRLGIHFSISPDSLPLKDLSM